MVQEKFLLVFFKKMPGIFWPFSDDKGVLLLSTVVKSGAQTSSLRLWRLQCVDREKKDKG